MRIVGIVIFCILLFALALPGKIAGQEIIHQNSPRIFHIQAVTLRQDTVSDGQTLKHDNNHLTFFFHSINIPEGQNFRFKFKLDGLDDEWRVTDNTSVNYAYLAPGDYTFKAAAVTSDSLSAGSAVALAFKIAPPIWQSIWFKLFALVIFSLFCYLYFRTWSQDRLNAYIDEHRRNLEKLVEHMPVLVVVLDKYRRILLWNAECERVTGYSKEDVQGNPDALRMLLPDDERREALITTAQNLGGMFREKTVELTAKDGSIKSISWSSSFGIASLPDYDTWAVGIDITERLRDETRLKESEKLLKEAHEMALLGSYRMDFPSGEVVWSDQTFSIAGWDKELGPAKIGQYLELMHPDDRKRVLERLNIAAANLAPYDCHYRLITPSGELKHIRSVGKASRRTDGVTEIVGTLQDVSKLIETFDRLENSERKYKVLLENTPDVISLLDRQGRYLYISPSMSRYFNTDLDAAIGKTFAELEVDPQLAEMVMSKIHLTVKIGEPLQEEFTANLLPGPVVFRWHLIPEKDESGEVRSLVSIAHDITATRQLEHERLKASKLDSLGVLAGGIAHDFNNVLTSIMGNLSLAMTDETISREVKTLLDKAEAACNRASELTSRLLVFARGGVPCRKPVDLAGTVEAAVRQALEDSEVKASFDFPEDLYLVYADAQQLSSAIFNLTDNARQAMESGGRLEVVVRNLELDARNPLGLKAGCYVLISIRDFGSGIEDELKAKIFDPYFTTRPEASGLGLTAAYFIAGRHGGTIEVESTPGNGAKFNLFIQAINPVLTEPVLKAGKPSITGGPARILLMDDEHSLLDVSGRVIELLGFRVGKAADGEQALQMYREAMETGDPFHLVILDITVPGGMGGVEALKWLREMDPAVKAIVSSGYSNDPVMSNYRDFGFISVLPKPYRVNELQDIIVRNLKK